ncbi:dihydropteroate synthase [Blastococcus sp. BMG 814]|uniref:dihydropteroate synthase n=1 Tax=Blastococcus carthaginiensis TaxID=3050034 RepID=A0ABT9I8C8_9ACTN|nr:dihydropteroate synthase [Blastococcus carthaginiensis]MDP5181835.1 dihydropteroate synthase [Blastococcus carthaginiensis]
MHLQLGARRVDLAERPLVVGILNRTRDSFHDGDAYFALDRLLARAEQLVADGADVLEVGARPGGVGVAEVSADEECHLAAGTVAALRSRFDLPLAVDTTRAAVAAAAFAEGAVLGNDMSGFRDPGYLPAAASAGAAVIATHIRRPPGVPDPDPDYADLLGEVCGRLTELVKAAEAAGIGRDRIVLDPGIDLGKSWQQSLRLLARLDEVAALGLPVLVAVSNKIFLRRALELGDAPLDVATSAACALGAACGGHVVRVHDARVGRQAADLTYAVRSAR